MIILGIDPGLTKSGWAVINIANQNITFIDCGTIYSTPEEKMPQRLHHFHLQFTQIFNNFKPQEIAIEETFVNKNPLSSLKLGYIRGAIMLTTAIANVPLFEYSTTAVKKAITGAGRADKLQIQKMLQLLVPKAKPTSEDSADALAIAICHQYHRGLNNIISKIKL